MQSIDFDFISRLSQVIDKILLRLRSEDENRLICLIKHIIFLEAKRRKESLEDIYFSKVNVAKELKCSTKTLTRDMNLLYQEGAISKRIGTYHNGKRAIGNSLFIKVEKYGKVKIVGQKDRKTRIKDLLMLDTADLIQI